MADDNITNDEIRKLAEQLQDYRLTLEGCLYDRDELNETVDDLMGKVEETEKQLVESIIKLVKIRKEPKNGN